MLLIRRLLIILLAYTVGCIGAGLMIAAALGAFGDGVWSGASLAIGSYVCAIALLPTGIAITAGELLHWRSLLVWVGVGMAVGTFALLVLGDLTPAISEQRPTLFIAAGAIWGAIYWLIAGRHAGGHQRSLPAQAADSGRHT